MKITADEILEMLRSGDFETQLSGMDSAKVLIDQLGREAVNFLFTTQPEGCLAAALKLVEFGPVIVPELERRISLEGSEEAKTQAALLLLQFGSKTGVEELLEAVADRHELTVVIVRRLREAGIPVPGAAKAFTELLMSDVVSKDPYLTATLITELRAMGTPVPNEAMERLKRIAPSLVNLL